MKTLLMPLALIFFLMGCTSPTGRPKDEPLIWCGLDYSKVKMMGTLDFRRPDEIFPGILAQWNGLFNKEMLPRLEQMAKHVYTDAGAVTARNQRTSSDQIERRDGTQREMLDQSHITSADIV